MEMFSKEDGPQIPWKGPYKGLLMTNTVAKLEGTECWVHTT